MRVREWVKCVIVSVLFLSACPVMHAQNVGIQENYLCEIGVQGGLGYYVGDAAPHIFMNVRESYGIHFRYKFTKRWAIQAKISGQRISGNEYTMRGEKLNSKWTNRIYGADIMAEFNFFRFGQSTRFDKRIRPYTPYIFAGIGLGLYTDVKASGNKSLTAAGYLPLGFGFKWKFHERVGLNIAWQHNIWLSDDIEGQHTLNNRHHLNGWNWMNCDVTSMLTVAIVVELARAHRECKICNW
jgi:hypothetical protein